MASNLIGKQAVVIGAGMAGLTAAGALADSFDQVVVLERDTLPEDPAYRVGTPQARHVHALLVSGQRALSELFPGFEQDLARATIAFRNAISAGSVTPCHGRRSSAPYDGAWKAARTLRYARRCGVQEVLATPDGAAITGVRYENGGGASRTIAADLVVDASGRGALTLALLQSIVRPLPEETTIGIDLGYATCVFATRNGGARSRGSRSARPRPGAWRG
jgi:flavin-dependent dehydrogenase